MNILKQFCLFLFCFLLLSSYCPVFGSLYFKKSIPQRDYTSEFYSIATDTTALNTDFQTFKDGVNTSTSSLQGQITSFKVEVAESTNSLKNQIDSFAISTNAYISLISSAIVDTRGDVTIPAYTDVEISSVVINTYAPSKILIGGIVNCRTNTTGGYVLIKLLVDGNNVTPLANSYAEPTSLRIVSQPVSWVTEVMNPGQHVITLVGRNNNTMLVYRNDTSPVILWAQELPPTSINLTDYEVRQSTGYIYQQLQSTGIALSVVQSTTTDLYSRVYEINAATQSPTILLPSTNTWTGFNNFSNISISTPTNTIGIFQVKDKYLMVYATSTSIIQAALDLGTTGCTVVVLPTGSNIVQDSCLEIKYDSVTLMGHGLSTTIVPLAYVSWGTPDHLLKATGRSGITIKGLSFNGSNITTLMYDAINFGNCYNIKVDDCYVSNSRGRGIMLDGCGDSSVSNCKVQRCNKGIKLAGYWEGGSAYKYGKGLKAVNNFVYGITACQYGIELAYTYGGLVVGNYVRSCQNAIALPSANWTANITGNTMLDSDSGLYLYASGASILGNNIYTMSQYGIQLDGAVTNCTIGTNNIDTTTRHGIYVGGYSMCTNVAIRNNTIKSVGTGYDTVNVTRCNGLFLTGNLLSSPNARYGIYCVEGSSMVIAQNDVFGHTTGDINISTNIICSRIMENNLEKNRIFADNSFILHVSTCSNNFGINTATPTATLFINGSVGTVSKTVSTNYTLTAIDSDILANGSITLTLPSASNLSTVYYITNTGTGTITINSLGGLIDNESTQELYESESVIIKADKSNWWIK